MAADWRPGLPPRLASARLPGGESATRSCTARTARPRSPSWTETDSGLDVDAARGQRRVNRYRSQHGGILLMRTYTRILRYIHPEYVHVFVGGRIVESVVPELAATNSTKYVRFSPAKAGGTPTSASQPGLA